MNTSIKQSNASTGWFHQVQQKGYYVKEALSLTLILGICLHVTGLVIGHQQLINHLFTPTVDMIFAIPMTYAGIMAWVMWKRIVHPALWHTVIYTFLALYFTVSIPLHVQVYSTQNTSYILAFPWWYSFVILPVMVGLLTFVVRLKFTEQSQG